MLSLHSKVCIFNIYEDFYCLYGSGRNTLRPYYVHKLTDDKLDTILQT